MKIALPHQNGNIYMSFTRTGQFIIYETEGKEILSSKIVFTHGQGAKGLAELLSEENVELVLCKSAGSAGMKALDDECIEVLEGYEGKTGDAISSYLAAH